jgi:hypothetical protein
LTSKAHLTNVLIVKRLVSTMQVIILSDGMGKKLKPLTEQVPKPLVPLNNIPIIECAKK